MTRLFFGDREIKCPTCRTTEIGKRCITCLAVRTEEGRHEQEYVGTMTGSDVWTMELMASVQSEKRQLMREFCNTLDKAMEAIGDALDSGMSFDEIEPSIIKIKRSIEEMLEQLEKVEQ